MSAIRTHSSVLALVVAAGITLTACDGQDSPARAYCDAGGCYTCDFLGTCQRIPNDPCTSDTACEADSQCTTIGCAKRCARNADCAGKERCQAGLCIPEGFSGVKPVTSPPPSCSKDAECDEQSYCRSGKCVERCTSDDGCAPGQVCSPCGKCQARELPATCGEVPSFCSAKTSCGSDKTCILGRCHFQCQSSGECPVGQTCLDQICKDDPDPGQDAECKLDLECASGVCINGTCHPDCTATTQCDPRSVCRMGICQPDYAPAR